MRRLLFSRSLLFLIGITLLLPVTGICASLHFDEPERFKTYSELPIEVVIEINGPVDLDTFEVELNDKNITDVFDVVDGDTLVGSIDLEDGLAANSGRHLGTNVLKVEIKDENGKKESRRRLFFTKDLDVQEPDNIFDGTYVGQATIYSSDYDMRMVIKGNDVTCYAIVMGGTYKSDIGKIDEDGNITFEFIGGGPLGLEYISGVLTNEYMSGEFKMGASVGEWFALKAEGFETGDFSVYPWVTDASNGWTVTDTAPANGEFAAQAPILYDNESASLEITRECEEGQIRFSRKVDSEFLYDFLYFYIDDELKGAWSGNIGYTQAACPGYTTTGWPGYAPSGWKGYTQAGCDMMSGCMGYTNSGCVGYTVTDGTHTFKWVYEKDGSVSGGSDSAWIDNVQFPSKPE